MACTAGVCSRMHVLHRHIAAAELPHSGMLPQASRSSATVPEGIEVRSRMLELMDGTLPVDPMTGIPDPAPLIRLRSAMADAAAAGQYKLALGLNQLLFAVEPRPPVSLEECVGGNTMAEKAAFFDKHGCIVVPALFEDAALKRLQRCWGKAQRAAREQWEEARAFGILPKPMDGIYFENQTQLNQKFPHIGQAGFGRKWFDIPRKDFYAEAEQPDGDPSILELIDPPKLLEVLAAVCGGDDIRCIGIQPRTVPPDGGVYQALSIVYSTMCCKSEGGYTAWHRDMQDNQSVAVSFPTDGRIVKAIIYLHDCQIDGGANGVVLGTHKLPFTPGEVYGKQFYDGKEDTRHCALPLDRIPNHVAFTLPAGSAAIFDISAWHTGMANAGPHDRQNMIMSYMRAPRFSQPRPAAGIPNQTLRKLAELGRLTERRRRVLSLP